MCSIFFLNFATFFLTTPRTIASDIIPSPAPIAANIPRVTGATKAPKPNTIEVIPTPPTIIILPIFKTFPIFFHLFNIFL